MLCLERASVGHPERRAPKVGDGNAKVCSAVLILLGFWRKDYVPLRVVRYPSVNGERLSKLARTAALSSGARRRCRRAGKVDQRLSEHPVVCNLLGHSLKSLTTLHRWNKWILSSDSAGSAPTSSRSSSTLLLSALRLFRLSQANREVTNVSSLLAAPECPADPLPPRAGTRPAELQIIPGSLTALTVRVSRHGSFGVM